jgi:hypothetical protein
MPSPAGDWEYEDSESEPEAADLYDAADLSEAEDAEYEPEYEPEGEPEYEPEADYRRPAPPPWPYASRPYAPARPYGLAVKGVQTAVVKTPAGNANIQLPSRVPTLAEVRGTFNRVQRDVAATNRRLKAVAVKASRSQRLSVRAVREDTRAARNGILIVALEQVKDILRDVGTLSLVRSVTEKA